MFKYAGIIFGGMVLLLAGCTSIYQGSESEPVPKEWSQTSAAFQPPATNKIPPAIKTIPAPASHANPPPPKTFPPAPILTWTSLDRWAVANKITGPRRMPDSPVASYAVSSPRGTMILEIGSREATWNGVELHLGFAPEIIDDQLFVHCLDLQKNLEPLLLGEPLAFGANRVIVIDPGHGGSNSGTVSVLDGRLEKEFTLDTALRLKPLLEAEGWKVFLTRTADVDFANSNRVTFATAHHADLFISLHFNATDDRSRQTGGIETYCLTPTGLPSTKKRGDYPDPLSAVWPDNAFDAQNLQLAVKLHGALIRATGLEDRGVCRVRYMTVVRGQNCPAVLIENGYLSSPHDARLIESPEFRQKLAETIATALK